MANYRTRVTQVQIGANTSTAVKSVTQKIGTPRGGDFIEPRLVANTVGPVGPIHLHKWWEVEVILDEEDETLLFAADLISPNTTNVTTLGEGATLNITLILTEKRETGTTRTITYTSVYVKNWGDRITNGDNSQPIDVTFFSNGTRTVTVWA